VASRKCVYLLPYILTPVNKYIYILDIAVTSRARMIEIVSKF